jgi:MoaA/NifB/PqqE/SkfB family radical SAM enzyme
MLLEADWRGLAKFVWSFGVRGAAAMRRFRRRERRGEQFPPFLFISVTNACNLSCQGCWVTADGGRESLSVEDVDGIISAGKSHGVWFYGLLGGEPLLHEGLTEMLDRHRDCYFQVFTNGTLMTDALAREFRRLGNVTPLVSIEGLAETSDERRGGREVYERTLRGLALCRRHRLITGVASSLCRSNVGELLTRRFVRELIARGVHYVWYYLYRPVGPDPCPQLALSAEQVLQARRFIVETRTWAPVLIIDAYWDHRGRAVCPAAHGVSFHVSPAGDVEPCPPIQFAAESVRDQPGLFQAINGSDFLRGFRSLAHETTPGCILVERPDVLRRFVAERRARDTSGRGTALAELAAMTPGVSQHVPGREIPERHWFYRFAKRHWFFGLGSYA